MLKLLIDLLLMGVIVLLGAYFVPGIKVDGFGSAIIAAILIALANGTIGFILRLLTFPINFLTLGLFSFIITVLMILLVSNIMEGFEVDGFIPAAFFAIVVAILKMIIGAVRS
ncbi:phage holin family protein [Pedobacter flavus]|uniref:Phage holin family protein n=1 Tax=Pedobacter flavus TaxID=3113906 RepID=A0ABU7GZ54_9SPHI|nr:phage holin family protein [Pedobacter sp. VNH31]MEE1884306.1 phage holin family protein [Pedobacter sp. VNH31]